MSNQNRHELHGPFGIRIARINSWGGKLEDEWFPRFRFIRAIRSIRVIRGGFGVDVGFSERTRC